MRIIGNRIIISLLLIAGAIAFWEFELRVVSRTPYVAGVVRSTRLDEHGLGHAAMAEPPNLRRLLPARVEGLTPARPAATARFSAPHSAHFAEVFRTAGGVLPKLLPKPGAAHYSANLPDQRTLRPAAVAVNTENSRPPHPPSGSPPQTFVRYYLRYLSDHPQDQAALRSLAVAEGQLGNYAAAIAADQGALHLNPQDVSAERHLALVLSWNRQYSASIKIYLALLQKSPKSRSLLQSLSRVYVWSGQRKQALQVDSTLQSLDPSSEPYAISAARLNMDLENDSAADKILLHLLGQQPNDVEARILEAQLRQKEGRLGQALDDYDLVLAEDFENAPALYGAAQIDFYQGRSARAFPLATRLVEERPADFDALLLLARIDRARSRRKAALALLSRAALLNSGNRDVKALEAQIHTESAVTIHTAASYAREVGQDGFGRETEDLNSYGGSTRIGFSMLPKSQSYVQLSSSPTNSPAGGIQGAVAPAELFYGQTTQISGSITARGGAGVVRMGPGEIFMTGPSPTRSVAFTPVGFAGFGFRPVPKVSLDIAVSRDAITYTPTSVRFGATRARLDASLSYALDGRTRFRASYFHERDSAPVYEQTNFALSGAVLLERNGNDSGTGGSVEVNRGILHLERLSLDIGYSGTAFGYTGQSRGVFMGFFNPTFYQRHFATSRFQGKLWGPLDYTLLVDFGVQQVDQGQPLTQAYQAGPALTLRLSRGHSITIGYLHYNSALSLGKLKGNVLTLSSDWGF